LLDLAGKGIAEIVRAQKTALERKG
jgi:hypothetical protein